MQTDHDLRIRPHKVGCVCLPFDLGPYVTVRPDTVAEEGAAVAARVLTARKEYGHLELRSGRKARLVPGDLIIGVLGSRAALRGFCGRVPAELRPGDILQLLNQGGVIGRADGQHAGLGAPIDLEILGTPIRDGHALRLSDYALPARALLPASLPPVLMIVGTCMHAGKTTAAAVITRHLRGRGLVVHAGKVTGVASIGDLLMFADNGANKTLSFLDCGLASTCYRDDIPQVATTLLAHLADESPDLIVLEMGDGLLGEYGVEAVLEDAALIQAVSGVVLAANDTVGAIAAAQHLTEVGLQVKVVVGPATDSAVGTHALARHGLDSANVLLEPQRVCALATAGLTPELAP